MIRFFIEHKTAANLLMILVLFFGIQSAFQLQRATFPDAKLGEIEISVIYPGATPAKIEESICLPMESALESLVGQEEIQCLASANRASIIVFAQEGADFERLLQDTKTEVEAVDTLPEESEDPVIRHRNRLDPLISLLVSADLPPNLLLDYAQDLKDRLLDQTDLAKITILGFSQRQFQIRLSEGVLNHYNVSLPELASRIQASNQDIPIGVIHSAGQEMRLSLDEEASSIQELENIVVLTRPDGFEMKLGDIASIEAGFEYEEDKILVGSSRGALLKFEKNPSDDSLILMKQVEDFVKREKSRSPGGVNFHLTQDNASIVKDRLVMLQSNAVQGLILVSLVLYLFFNLRFSFWVVMGLPVSFAGSFFLMQHADQSINMMTMVGLLLGIGILMDDAVVISENIASHFHRGKTAIEAAIDGTAEVFSSVLSSFLTTVAMFGGLVFMTGDIGRILNAIPLVLIFVLSASLIEAFLILPHHMKDSLRQSTCENPLRVRFLRFFDHFRDNIFGGLVRKAVTRPYLSVGIILLLFFFSLSMISGGLLRFSALPDLEGSVVVSRILMPSGTPLKNTEVTAARVAQSIYDLETKSREKGTKPFIRGVYTRFNENRDVMETGSHVATVYVDLMDPESRNIRLVDLLDNWRKTVGTLPGVSAISFQEPALGPAGRPIHLRFFHKDLKVLQDVARKVKSILASFSGVSNVMSDLRIGQPEAKLRVLPGTQGVGVLPKDLGTQLFSSIRGLKISDIPHGDGNTEVILMSDESDQSRLDFLDSFQFVSPQKQRVPLDRIANASPYRDFARISRSNGKRMLNITAEIDAQATNAGAIVSYLKKHILPVIMKENSGLNFIVEGQLKNAGETTGSIRKAFIGGLVALFLILSYQFGCYLQPLLILFTIPFSLIGVVFGHLILGFDLSLPSMMGLVALSGVMVNNSIMLVHFIGEHSKVGMNQKDAAIEASIRRFRPIFITTATTLAGMLPLLFERSLQAQILQPLVISLCFGLAASTILVLIFIPSLYSIREDILAYIHSS